MTKNARKNYIKAVSQQVDRKKMYKAKKNWIVAGMSFLVMTGLAAVGNHLTTYADTINANTKPNTIKQPSITDQATKLHNKIMNNNTYKLGVQPKQSSAVANQNTKSSNSSVGSVSAQSNVTSNSVKDVKNNKVNTKVNNNTDQSSVDVKNNQVEQPSVKANNSLSTNSIKQSNANSSSASENTNKGVKSSKLANNSLNKNKEPLIKAHINLGDSNDARSKASDNHWIYDNGKYISSMPSTDTISDGTYDGLAYKYDKTLQALEFTGGKINTSDTSDFLNVSQFGGEYDSSDDIGKNNTLKSVKFDSDIDTSNVTNMSDMFNDDYDLSSLNLGNHFDTSNVTNMYNMFFGDYDLSSLDLGDKFDTSKVTDMYDMFDDDSKLSSLDLGNHFDTSNVTNMSNMFNGNTSLSSLDLGDKFDTSNVTNMSDMFSEDYDLTSLDLGNKFDTNNVINMRSMFQSDNSLQSLDLGNYFDTHNVTDMMDMFNGDSKLPSLDFGNKFDTSNVTNMSDMFQSDNSLQSLDLGNYFDTHNVTDMSGMFREDSKLSSLDLGNKFDTSNVTNMSDMFSEDYDLTSLDLGNKFDTSNVTDMSNMFVGDSKLPSLDLGNKFDTSNVTDMDYMFSGDYDLTSLDLGNKFDTSNVTNMRDMFSEDSDLSSLNLGSKFDTHNVADMSDMFGGDSKLPSLDLGNKFDTSKVTDMYDMFGNDGRLQKLIIQSTKTLINSDAQLDNMYKQLPIKDNNGNNYTAPSSNDFSKGNIGIFLSNFNIPSDIINYQYNGKTLSTQQFKATNSDYNGIGYNDLDVNSYNATSLPTGYHLVNADNNIPFDGDTHTVDVTPNQITDTINYETSDGNAVGIKQFTGKYNTSFDASSGVPSNYTANGNTSFIYDGSTHTVNITPNQITDTINYETSDGNAVGIKQFTGKYNTSFDASSGVPSNYIANGNTSFIYHGDIHTVYVTMDKMNDNILFHDIYSDIDGFTNPNDVTEAGDPSSKYTVSSPSGWAIVNSQGQIINNPTFTYNSGNHTVDVAPVDDGLTYKYNKNTDGIEFVDGTANNNLSNFSNNSDVKDAKSITFDTNANMISATNLHNMLSGDTTLQSLDFKNTLNGNANMNYMLADDDKLKAINFTNSTHSNQPEQPTTHKIGKKGVIYIAYELPNNQVAHKSAYHGAVNAIFRLPQMKTPNGYHWKVILGDKVNEFKPHRQMIILKLTKGSVPKPIPTSTVKSQKEMFLNDNSLQQINIGSPNITFSSDVGLSPKWTKISNYTYDITTGNTGASDSVTDLDNNKSHIGDWIKVHNVTDTVFYIDDNNGNLIKSTQITGNEGLNAEPNIEANKPSNYSIVFGDMGATPKFAPNETLYVPVVSNSTTDTINFINQNGTNVGNTTTNGTPNTSFAISNIPTGYQIDTSKNSNQLTYDGQHHTVYLIGNQVSGTATVHLTYNETNGKVDNTRDIQIPINAHVGDNSMIITPWSYWKANYNVPTNVFTINFPSSVAPSSDNNSYNLSDTFNYTGKTAANLVVKYVDTDSNAQPINPNHSDKEYASDNQLVLATQDLGQLGVVGSQVKLGQVGANDGAGVLDELQVPENFNLVNKINTITLSKGATIGATDPLGKSLPNLIGKRVMLLTVSMGTPSIKKNDKPSASAKPASTEAKQSSVSSVSKSVTSSVASNIAKPSSSSSVQSLAKSSTVSSKNSSASSVASQSASSSASSVESSTDFKSVVNSLNQQLSELSLAMNNEVSSAFSMNNLASASSTPSSAVQSTSSSANSGLVNFDDDRLYKVVEAPQVVMHKVGKHQYNKHLLIVHFRKYHVLFLERHHGFVMTLRRHNKISVRKIRYIHIHHGRVVIRLRNGRYVKVNQRYFHRIRKFLRK